MDRMRTVVTLTAALLLTLTASACGKDSADSASSSTTAGGTAAASTPRGGGSTPQEAVHNVFKAIGASDANTVCQQMAFDAGGKKSPVGADTTRLATCQSGLASGLSGLPAEQRSMMSMVTVTGAQEKGDTATITGKDISFSGQSADALLTSPLTLSKLDGRWYLDLESISALAGAFAGATASASAS